jgi:hypothetical protein
MLIMGPTLESLKDFPWDHRKRLRWNTEGAEGLKLGDLLLEMLHPGGRRLRFQLLKPGLCLARHHQQQLVKCGADLLGQALLEQWLTTEQ